MEDSQSPTQFDNDILDQAVLGGLGGAHGALARYDAELAQFAADEMEAEDDDEGYTIDDPDVDVVGVTQVETPPYIHIDVTEAVESRMESTGESHHDDNAGESGGTVLNTIDEWLSALADAFGAIYSWRIRGDCSQHHRRVVVRIGRCIWRHLFEGRGLLQIRDGEQGDGPSCRMRIRREAVEG
ncbi:hypothetical protein RSAG8_06752, partial [Rhizoctonia solani AG-8 WAC10335]